MLSKCLYFVDTTERGDGGERRPKDKVKDRFTLQTKQLVSTGSKFKPTRVKKKKCSNEK
jgi:hypothetical protein